MSHRFNWKLLGLTSERLDAAKVMMSVRTSKAPGKEKGRR
jgi:hypothetical protein